jgi:Tfp pilus assembly protein PilF
MLILLSGDRLPRRPLLLSVLTLLLFLNAGYSHAQGIGAIDSDPSQAIGTRVTARNTLQGRVTLPSGALLDRRVKVRISGATGGSLFAMTDDNGAFIFQRLAGGTYFLTVDAGKEYEMVSEVVDIYDPGGRSARGSVQTLQIQLRLKGATTGKPATIDAALAGVPKPALKLYQKALEAAQAGDNKKAVEALKGAVEIDSTFMLAFNMLGVQYLLLNRPDDAAQALRTALDLAPEDFNPRLNYGIVLFYQRQFQEAGKHLRKAIERRETSAAAHFFLGRVLIKEHEYREAEKALQRAVSLGGTEINEAYRYLGGIYKELGDNARAVESLEKYLKLEPKAKDADGIRQIIAELRAQPSVKP